jgi:two-component system chemotaxis response regulator CheY
MSKKILLVGHCGPDSSFLRLTIKKSAKDAEILSADDGAGLTRTLEAGEIDLVLFNRELGFGFEPDTGVEMIRVLRQTQPDLKMILVSNYPDAQQAAEAAGALPGFGKRELGTPRVTDLIRDTLGLAAVR